MTSIFLERLTIISSGRRGLKIVSVPKLPPPPETAAGLRIYSYKLCVDGLKICDRNTIFRIDLDF